MDLHIGYFYSEKYNYSCRIAGKTVRRYTKVFKSRHCDPVLATKGQLATIIIVILFGFAFESIFLKV